MDVMRGGYNQNALYTFQKYFLHLENTFLPIKTPFPNSQLSACVDLFIMEILA